MNIRDTLVTVTAFAFILAAFPAFAEDPNWNGDPDPEPPTVTPEPEPETPTTTPDRPTESWADRHKPQSRPLPCCIRDGQIEPRPTLFMSERRAMAICERATADGAALIYECPGVVSPEATK